MGLKYMYMCHVVSMLLVHMIFHVRTAMGVGDGEVPVVIPTGLTNNLPIPNPNCFQSSKVRTKDCGSRRDRMVLAQRACKQMT